jgi:hypothetical protein
VEDVLAKAVLELVVSIELTDDDDIDPDVSTSIVEPVAHLLTDVSDDVRQELVRLFHAAARQEENPERRTIAEEFPEAIGLVDTD